MAFCRQRIHLPPRAWRRALAGLLRRDLWDGDTIDEFERAFAAFIGTPAAVAVPSGRAGFAFTLKTLDLPRESEIIFSAFAYPVIPHLARSLGYRVRFVDCEMETLGMDPEALAEAISEKTRAVVVTHLYGVPCRIREIAEIVRARGAILIEDCAHCFGASVGGRKAGSFGSFGYFSFETSKPINTLGGGIVTVGDEATAERLRTIARKEPGKNLAWLLKRLVKTTFEATVTHPLGFNLAVYPALRLLGGGGSEEEQSRFASGYQRDEVTLEGRMGRYTHYQAGLGLSQMDGMPAQVEKRVANAKRLIGRLRSKVQFQTNDAPDVTSNYMLVTALFPDVPRISRDLLLRGVDTKHRYMRDCSGLVEDAPAFPHAARAEKEVLHLPAYPELNEAQIDTIAEQIEQAVVT